MTRKFHELLLSELHMAAYEPGIPEQGSDNLLCRALTVNENLASLGYTLRPDDIVRLSVSDSLNGFFKQVKALVPDVKAAPMYPGFPQQVMKISEAEFRMHQLIHYFSTYGIETLTGMQVSKGWLPEFSGPVRNKHDETLLSGKVIELIPEQEAPRAVLEVLLQRRERLTNPELALVLESAQHCTPEQLKRLKIRFKENLDLLFPMLMQEADRQIAFEALRAICAHSGDILRCGEKYLYGRRFHLKTREKKLLVKLLEAYPVRNLKDNLMLSNKARERNLLLLQYLDYNRFSRSPEHLEAVRALRNGELLSWQGIGEKLLNDGKPEALQYFARRPGYLVRMLNRLLALGYEEDAIQAVLVPASEKLSGHLIMKTVRQLTKRKAMLDRDHQLEIQKCCEKYRREQIEPRLDMWLVEYEAREKERKIKEKWLDGPEKKIRRDAFQPLDALTDRLTAMKKKLTAKKNLLVSIGLKKRNSGSCVLVQNANMSWNPEMILSLLELEPETAFHTKTERLDAEIALLETEIAEQNQLIQHARAECRQRYERLVQEMRERNMPYYEAELNGCGVYEKAYAAHEKRLAEYKEAMKTLPARKAKELEQLEKQYQEMRLKMDNDEAVVRILTAVLKEHFRQAVTPLRGKKVFLDMDEFDLDHSELETEDRSKDGGYIRSGICFKIPENAKLVRFFVYWNDETRVDIDLHAAGMTTRGAPLDIGWNVDFREAGVVHSGDITHSDAAEYIDIDLSAPIQEIDANIHLYSGKDSFQKVETCYVGLMAIQKAGQDVKLYNPKNCFFTHKLTQNITSMKYGYIDVQNRYIRFVGQQDDWTSWHSPKIRQNVPFFSLRNYLNTLLEGQESVSVSKRKEADLVLTMGKSGQEKGLSLTDHNFFLES